jgi:uncharacterized membrane protein YbhN (UPF0104 family)
VRAMKTEGKSLLKSAIKLVATLVVFVGLFAEFGGGPVPVARDAVTSGTAFQQVNPAMPGVIGKLKAKVSGAALPAPTVPVDLERLCRAGAEGPIFATTTDAKTKKIKILGHCEQDRLARVLQSASGPEVPLAEASGDTVWLVSQGFQLVPMDWRDLLRELTHLDLRVFLPWFAFATLVKLLGIFANIYRWQILLRGQGLRFDLPWLTASYFVGRYWGIVTPSTMGLDGWRLYDTIRLSRKPVECTTAIVVERLIGLVGLFTVILLFMPFVSLGGRDLAELLSAMKIPIAAAVLFGVLLLLQPRWFQPLVRLMPHPKLKSFLANAITSLTAYASARGSLLVALACAVIGQLTTMFMYFGNAMALQVEGVTMAEVLYASAVMTLGTFLAPSASGEGVRELVFVALLGGKTTAAKAFLIGHLGFWIEKLPLSLPGGLVLLRAPESYKRITREDLEALKAETAQPTP